MDCSPPGSSVHGIFQARMLVWVCHFLLQDSDYALSKNIYYFEIYMVWEASTSSSISKLSRSVVSDSLRPHGRCPIRLLRPWDFPGKSAGVDCHFLLHSSSTVGEKYTPILKKGQVGNGRKCAKCRTLRAWSFMPQIKGRGIKT